MKAKGYKQILNFATKAHKGQKRKYTNDDYINHPIAVAKIVKSIGGSDAQVLAAILHDVIEDTKVDRAELKTFLLMNLPKKLATETYNMVDDLTDVFVPEDFPNMNRTDRKIAESDRLSKTPAKSQTVKYADIIHNLDSIMKHDEGFAKKFIEEKDRLLSKMNKGNNKLYKKAIQLTQQ